MSSFGEAVRRYRVRNHLSQRELGEAVGFSAGYIGLIEAGRRASKPSRETCVRLVKALSLTLDETEQLFRAGGHLAGGEQLVPDERGNRFLAAVEADPVLTEEHRALLIKVYNALARHRGKRRRLEPRPAVDCRPT